MEKLSFKTFILVALFLGTAFSAQAAEPVLNFSDLTSGPDLGLGDGLGVGTIITIWGNNLGDSQAGSMVYFEDSLGVKRPVAHVYYWGRADGTSGPAELYDSHGLYEVSFSIPSGAVGSGTITVVVEGIESNGLTFVVRSGNIYYVKATGNNSNDGSWDSPWLNFSDGTGGATTKMAIGDIVYGYDSTEAVIGIRTKDGTPNNEYAIVSYPGHNILVTSGGVGPVNIIDKPSYWQISKVDITTLSGGITPLTGSRIVGNRIWDGSTTGNNPSVDCAEGGSGAISSGGEQGGAKIFGNYIHDFGCYATSNQHHTLYFSVRGRGNDIAPIDMGWNHLKNNWARMGIHFYDEHACWGYSGKTLIHHNVVDGQVGPCFNMGGNICDDGFYITGDFDVYNNIFKECGQLGANNTSIAAIAIMGDQVTGEYNFYNNTIVDYGYSGGNTGTTSGAIAVSSDAWSPGYPFAGNFTFTNNIIVDKYDLPYSYGSPYALFPTTSSNNLWYNGDNGSPVNAPTWDTVPITINPIFTDYINEDFTLQTTSPAKNTGVTIASIITDFLGTSRPQGSAYDIGAYEYQETGVVIRADVDQNSFVNTTDALLTLRNSLGLNMSSTNWQASAITGDVNCDGSSNSTDALLILRSSLGLNMGGTDWCIN
jgi:hypothetical protein